MKLPAIYPITDRGISGLSIPEQVRRLIAAGAELIQIRDKNASARELLEACEASIKIAREHGGRIIINDRVDIAAVVKADGVHLGQTDLKPQYAREILGPEAMIGYSTHSIEQAELAAKMPIDYLAFGPVFPTSTKADPDPVVGAGMLQKIKEIAGRIPLVAIGGITVSNIADVFENGADSAAIIRKILSPGDAIGENLTALLAAASFRQERNNVLQD